jgi:hypothetical protein
MPTDLATKTEIDCMWYEAAQQRVSIFEGNSEDKRIGGYLLENCTNCTSEIYESCPYKAKKH